jgi:hypothetical protein
VDPRYPTSEVDVLASLTSFRDETSSLVALADDDDNDESSWIVVRVIGDARAPLLRDSGAGW